MKRAVGVALALALLGVAAPALGNGRLPSAGQIVLAPADPALVLLRTTFGIVLSRDRGTTWDTVCESAMHYGGAQDPPYALSADGHILLVSSLGYVRGDGWHFDATVPLRGARDLSVGADTLVLTSNFRGEDDAGAYRFSSWLLRGNASGEGVLAGAGHPLPDDVLFETVEAVPTRPERIVLSGAAQGSRSPERGFLFVSDDGGEHVLRLSVPLERGESSVYVAGIEAEGERVYVRAAGSPSAPGRLLVGGFAELLERARRGQPAGLREILRLKGPLLGFALDAAGMVYAGGDDGVWRARTSELRFAQRTQTPVRCLAARESELWACGGDASTFLAGLSLDGGATFTSKLALHGIRGVVDSDEIRAACTEEWQSMLRDFGEPQAPPAWPWRGYAAVGAGLAATLTAAGWWFRRRSRRFREAR